MNKFETAKERVTITEILSHFNIAINRSGFICCPNHNEKNPSCKVYKNNVKCFSCGFNGSVVDITMIMLNCDKCKAITYLGNTFKLGFETVLTYEQKKEWAKEQRKKEEEKKRLERLKIFEREILDKIIRKLRKLEYFLYEYRWEEPNDREEWSYKVGNKYFECLKKYDWCEWLYNIICGFETKDCEYNYTIGTDKLNVLRHIYIGKIKI